MQSAISFCLFFFSSRRRHTRFDCDWSSDVCSSDLLNGGRDTIPPALGERTFHPFGDFLLHNVGTGDGIVMAMPEHYGPAVYKVVWREFSIDSVGRTRNKVRTAPLWGVRLRPRLMHAG